MAQQSLGRGTSGRSYNRSISDWMQKTGNDGGGDVEVQMREGKGNEERERARVFQRSAPEAEGRAS